MEIAKYGKYMAKYFYSSLNRFIFDKKLYELDVILDKLIFFSTK